MSQRILTKQLLEDFMLYIKPFSNLFGVHSRQKDEMQLAREFINRFFSNLVAIENHLGLKDSISSVLVQRYNHEMMLDFFYIFSSKSSQEKVNEFFSYEERLIAKPSLRQWQTDPHHKNYVPPWISNEIALKGVYKRMSDMAHSNIISMRLNRRGEPFEFYIVKNAACFIVMEITLCFLYKPFRDLVYANEFDMPEFCAKMREFQARAENLLILNPEV